MFEVILFAIIVYYLYRSYSKRKSSNVKKKRPRPVYYYGTAPQTPPQNSPQSRVIEEMKRCPACGTFNPKSYTLYYEGEYFCSMECRNQKN